MADGDLTFGVQLTSYRRSAGLSQDGLAQRTGLSVRTISNLERGRARWPHADSVHRLAEALELRGRRREKFFAAATRQRPGDLAVPAVTGPGGQAGQDDGEQAQADRAVAAEAPRQLPAPVSGFAGRAGELAALDALLAEAQPGPPTPALVISAIGGTAGVGKTALAVQWAHRVAGQFPGGQLYVNLRGYDPDLPVTAGDALAGFLRSLGVPGQQIPDATEDRARMYRSRLAGRRVLVLLDNARDGAQVRPLLPGDPACVAVVTSRDALAGLVAADGARRLDLDVLPLADAVALLRSLIGVRADDDQQLAALAGLCARLPLALRIAAELATARPSVPLTELVAELEAGRLDYLDAGEDRAEVRAVFSWSLRQLPDDAAHAFALLSLHPGQDLDVPAAAALTGTSAREAAKLLARLHRASLIQASGPGRYSQHDLLRAYGREQAAARGDGPGQQAMTRLFDYYLAAAAAAMDILLPADATQRPPVPPSAAVAPVMAGQAEARAWLDQERANLTAVVGHGAAHGWPQHATRLGGTLLRYLLRGAHLPEGQAIYSHALRAARKSGDLAAEAEALNGLGAICYMKGLFGEAAGHYHAALALSRLGERALQARLLFNLGQVEHAMHHDQAAVDHYSEAQVAYLDAGDSPGAARALIDLAEAEIELGRYDQAAGHLERALPVVRAAGDLYGEGSALEATGILSLRRGQLTQAAGSFEQALAIFRRLGFPTQVAAQFFNLADISLRQADYGQAIVYLQQALTLFRQESYHYGEIRVLRSLAEARHGAGQATAAQAELTAALRLAAATDNTYQQAGAHRDLADGYHRAGDSEQARHHWRQALTLYTQLGAPEAAELRSHAQLAGGLCATPKKVPSRV
jgi:tetratricopeptide (TPR) repeat protein/transcriptional regulator with XRE-family HTH domain